MQKATILYFSITVVVFATASPSIRRSRSWWDNTILYQIYPRSFKDSDGDGVGDLRGITSKLEYVREFADTIWLSPIFPSPQKDFGYDVSNFTDIHHEYGSLKDFDELVAKAKSIGLKILLDFVPNHSSDQHEWFKKSVQRITPYDEYYIWNDGKLLPNGTRTPPNNWISSFDGSAWEWNENRGQYYYHQFLTSQPDLNYGNVKVQAEMEKVITFWLDRGVDGFRIDAVAHLYEDPLLRDEPRSQKNVSSNDYFYLEHIFTRDQNKTYQIVQSWRQLMDRYSDIHSDTEKLALMEVFSSYTNIMKYYTVNVDPMNFGFVHSLRNESTVEDFKNNIKRWLSTLPSDKTANWVVGNHDALRVGSRFGHNGNRADQISMLSAVLPGMTIFYNGDEIGMTNRYFTYEETVDPIGCKAGPEKYETKSRDPERTPFQWDDTISAGFSTNPQTWLPVNENYKTLNLAQQQKSETSHYKIVKALSDLKKEYPVMIRGVTRVYNLFNKVLVVVRRLPVLDPVAVLINFTDEDVAVDGRSFLSDYPAELAIYVASMNSGLPAGKIVQVAKVLVPKASTIVLASTKFFSESLNDV